MPQFDPSWFISQIFWLAVTFTIMYLLMSRLVLPRIGEVLEERSERLAADIDKAEALKKEADGVVAQYEAELAKAREQATKVLAQASQEISEIASRRQQEFGAELARKTADAEARIEAAKAEAKAQVRDIAQAAAGDIVEKLTGSSPTDQTVTRNVDAAMKETG
jgi:F-type H+-transporting ATPase subunit b